MQVSLISRKVRRKIMKARSSDHTVGLVLFPGAEKAADQDHLAQVIGVVVSDEQRFTKNGLPGAVRDAREEISLGIRQQVFSSPRDPAQMISGFSPTLSHSEERGYRANIRMANPARHVWDLAKIPGCPTAQFANARAIPTRNRAIHRDGFLEGWEGRPRRRFSNRRARRVPKEDSPRARATFFPQREVLRSCRFNLRSWVLRWRQKIPGPCRPSPEKFRPSPEPTFPFRR